MFTKLRIRFVFVVMLALIVVLTIIMTFVNIFNYNNVSVFADEILSELAKNDGKFPNNPDHGGAITPETPFETRFFYVTFYNDGRRDIDTTMVSAVNDTMADGYAKTVIRNNSARGYIGIYRYYSFVKPDGKMVIFMDCGRLLSSAGNFLLISIIISLAGIAVVGVIVALLSGKIISPFTTGYKKQKEFITNASHELKTPLTIISANCEIIELETGENECTESITRQVGRLASMVKNMTALAKLDEIDSPREKTYFSLSDCVSDAFEAYTAVAPSQGKAVATDIAPDVRINGSEDLLRQLLGVLLDNAIKYSKTYITIKLNKNKNRAELTVTNDTGGIEKGSLDKLFDRFYRLDSARASGIEGSGIGLSIAKEIVNIHKGRINAWSADGNEFCVKVII